MLVIVNGTDITPYINDSTYKIEAKTVSKEWEDGNFVTHKIVVREKISGKFRVALYGKDGMGLKEFLELWDSAVKNYVVTLSVFVQNKNKSELIEAFYDIKPVSHHEADSGVAVDVLEISLEER